MLTRIGNAFKRAYDLAYPPDTVDTSDPKSINAPDDVTSYHHKEAGFKTVHWLTRLAGYIGISNYITNKKKGQSLANLGKNFIGYQDNVSDIKYGINLALMPLIFLLNLIQIPFKLAINTAKLFTEVLPLLAREFCDFLVSEIKTRTNNSSVPIKTLGMAAMIAITLVDFSVFAVLHFVGRAITSPLKGIQHAWRDGGGSVPGAFLAFLSGAITFTAYAIFFPFAIKALAAPVMNFAATHLPAVVSQVITTVANAVNSSSVLASLGEVMKVVVNSCADHLTLGLFDISNITAFMSPAIFAIGATAAALIPTVGTAVDKLRTRFYNWWRKPEEPAPATGPSASAPAPVSAADDSTLDETSNTYIARRTQSLIPSVPAATATKPEETSVSGRPPVVGSVGENISAPPPSPQSSSPLKNTQPESAPHSSSRLSGSSTSSSSSSSDTKVTPSNPIPVPSSSRQSSPTASPSEAETKGGSAPPASSLLSQSIYNAASRKPSSLGSSPQPPASLRTQDASPLPSPR